jgi:hypothetical protein
MYSRTVAVCIVYIMGCRSYSTKTRGPRGRSCSSSSSSSNRNSNRRASQQEGSSSTVLCSIVPFYHYNSSSPRHGTIARGVTCNQGFKTGCGVALALLLVAHSHLVEREKEDWKRIIGRNSKRKMEVGVPSLSLQAQAQ